MVLSAAVFFGFGAGWLRARHGRRPLQLDAVHLRWVGLVFLAFLAQGVVFNRTGFKPDLSDQLESLILCGSQALLLVFTWVNRRKAGLLIMAFGLLLNLVVISMNGGWMPISPDAVRAIYPHASPDSWQIGQRLGTGKDIVLYPEDTTLEVLADRFVLPASTGYPMAFSLGDVLLAVGVAWLLWSLGGNPVRRENGKPQSNSGTPELNRRVMPGIQPAAICSSGQPALSQAVAVGSGERARSRLRGGELSPAA